MYNKRCHVDILNVVRLQPEIASVGDCNFKGFDVLEGFFAVVKSLGLSPSAQVLLVVGNLLMKVAVYNQPLDKVLERFVVVGMMPHILTIVTIPGCVILCRGCRYF